MHERNSPLAGLIHDLIGYTVLCEGLPCQKVDSVTTIMIGTPIRHLFVNWTAKFAGFLSHQTDRPTRGGGGRPGATPAAGQGGRAEGRPRRFGGGHAEKTPTPFLRGQKTGLRPRDLDQLTVLLDVGQNSSSRSKRSGSAGLDVP